MAERYEVSPEISEPETNSGGPLISRRDFLKDVAKGAVVVGAAAYLGADRAVASETAPQEGDKKEVVDREPIDKEKIRAVLGEVQAVIDRVGNLKSVEDVYNNAAYDENNKLRSPGAIIGLLGERDFFGRFESPNRTGELHKRLGELVSHALSKSEFYREISLFTGIEATTLNPDELAEDEQKLYANIRGIITGGGIAPPSDPPSDINDKAKCYSEDDMWYFEGGKNEWKLSMFKDARRRFIVFSYLRDSLIRLLGEN